MNTNLKIVKEFFSGKNHNIVEYHLYLIDKKIGYIGIDLNSKYHYVSVSNLEKKYRNKGYGKLLYETALKENKFISTYYSKSSDSARRVWHSLIKKYKYNTDFFRDTLTIYAYEQNNDQRIKNDDI